MGELRKNGGRIKLQQQPLQILLALIERRGDIVTREELREQLWPQDTFVDFDHRLNAAVKRLREALGALVWVARTTVIRSPSSSSKPTVAERKLTANSAENPIGGAAISPDGTYLAYSDSTGLARLQPLGITTSRAPSKFQRPGSTDPGSRLGNEHQRNQRRKYVAVPATDRAEPRTRLQPDFAWQATSGHATIDPGREQQHTVHVDAGRQGHHFQHRS